MDDIARTNIVKSKSSNGAITTKSERTDNYKKTKSTAEFQPTVSKKRGVYVDNNVSQTANTNVQPSSHQQQRRAPLRPRPDQKKFMSSVFTLLSKSTTGTQFPSKSTEKLKSLKKKTDHSNKSGFYVKSKSITTCEENVMNSEAQFPKIKKKKMSKTLNKEVNRRVEDIVELQTKKHLKHTPSIFSENSYRMIRSDSSKCNPEISNIRDYLDSINTEVELNKNKELRIKEHIHKNNGNNGTKTDSKMYDFFVELLETTLSAYKLKPQNENSEVPSESSSTRIEIEEHVADKLKVKRSRIPFQKEDTAKSWDTSKLLDYLHSQNTTERPSQITRVKKHKPKPKSKFKSPTDYKIKQPEIHTTASAKLTKKQQSPNTNLLNILKHELQLNVFSMKEPENFYDALKQIAKTKRKSIQFIEPERKSPNDECMLKHRRKILHSRQKKQNASNRMEKEISKSLYKILPKRYSDLKSKYYKEMNSKFETGETGNVSQHSLEVYNYESDKPIMKQYSNQEIESQYSRQPYRSVRKSSQFSLLENDSAYSITSPEAKTSAMTFLS